MKYDSFDTRPDNNISSMQYPYHMFITVYSIQVSEGTGFPVPYWHSSMAYWEVSPPYLFSSTCKHSVTHLMEYRHLLIWKKDKLFHHISIQAAKCLTKGKGGHSMLGLINQSAA